MPDRPKQASGVELLGPIAGSAYRRRLALVRRPDGQMVQLGPLMHGLLECMDGRRDVPTLAESLSASLGRQVEEEQCRRLLEKLAEVGLVEGFEQLAPPRRNPLLALRWKYLVTSPTLTRRLTAPFVFLFRPWVMWPVLLGFVATSWYVLVDKGVASATVQAFNDPGLLLLVFALTILSAGFHELGHAAACRYAGAEPGGMGVGLYLVWPAFYTDVTDAYRLLRVDRLRVDLAGLYFNAVVAVATMAAWLFWRVDALLLLVALQILQMVRQLSPIIRADGYHILADATGVPNLYAHLRPTLHRLAFWRRSEPSALTGWASVLVTVWVLVFVPLMLSLLVGAVLLLPHLLTNAWDSGRQIGRAMGFEIDQAQIVAFGANLLRLLALLIPVVGSILITQKVARTAVSKGRAWSKGSLPRRSGALALATLVCAGLAYAWWPAGQYRPVSASDRGSLMQLTGMVSGSAPAVQIGPSELAPGSYLAMAMVPVHGAHPNDPALFVLQGTGGTPRAIVSDATPPVVGSHPTVKPSSAAAFPFRLPGHPSKNGTQAEAVNTADGSTLYDVAFAVVTVSGGAPVEQTNAAYAIAHCNACTTVAVSYQIVLVVGTSAVITPVNAAAAVNYECPACTTTAIADQMIVTVTSAPSKTLLSELEADLKQLDDLSLLGAAGTPAAVAAAVTAVQQQVEAQLTASGILAPPLSTTSNTGTGSTTNQTPSSSPTTVPGTTDTSGSTTTTTSVNSSSTTSTTAPTSTSTTSQPTSSTSTTTAPSTTTP